MRIAMVDPSLFTLPYDRALARSLAKEGHEVALYGRRPKAEDGEASDLTLVEAFYRAAGSGVVEALPRGLRLGVKGADHVWSMVRLVGRLRRARPDVIHFQWLPLPVVDRRLVPLFRRIAPVVLTAHDTEPFNGAPSSRFQAHGYFDCIGQVDRVIVLTEQGRNRLRARGVQASRLWIVPHGATPRASSLGEDEMQGTLTFVLFGKLKAYKGADILIEAFARLPEHLRQQARIRIIGKPYMDIDPLWDLAKARGVAPLLSIEPGFVPDTAMPTIFGPGTIAVFPYRTIDASGVLFQAIEFGRPILATRLGLFGELLEDGAQGLLVAREDVDGLAAAMERFVADRDFAAACARATCTLSRSALNWSTVARRTAAIYEDAVAGRKGKEREPVYA